MVKWQNHINGFVTRVEAAPKLPDMDTLVGLRTGLTKRMRTETNKEKKARLRAIREEVDYLIDTL